MPVKDLKQSQMMNHLLEALENGEDIGQNVAVTAYRAEAGHQVRVLVDVRAVRGTSLLPLRAQHNLLVDEPGVGERPERGE